MRKVLIAAICLVLIVVVLFFSCENFQDKVFDVANNFLKNTISCKYEVAYNFKVASDRTIIEERLRKFNFTILEKEQSGSTWIYTLERHYKADYSLFELIATDESVELVNKTGEVALTKLDILTIKMEYEKTVLKVKDERYKSFSKDGEPQFFYFSNGKDKVYVADLLKGDNGLELFLLDEDSSSISADDALYIQGILNLFSKPLNGIISVEVLSEKVGLK